MKDVLARLVQNPNVRKAALALALAVAAAFGISVSSGCGSASVPPATARAASVLECKLAVLGSVVPRAAAEDIAMAARAGSYPYVVEQLLRLGLTPDKIRETGDAFGACSAELAPEQGAGVPDAAIERS